MSNLVIVAIPAEDDIVHKISSEKVPHLTLMYLGESGEDKNPTRMAEFIEHALNLNAHGPFYLEIDYRGELGGDKADVLFFEGGWEAKWIKSLRGQLLQQADIRAAYQSEDQFPEWVPHLTLGYPDSPAKPIPDDRRLYSVEFDRIAVWDGNYEGPEFRLKWNRNELAESHGETYDSPVMSMSSIDQARAAMGLSVGKVDEKTPLTHYGVKGMHWGQRKDTTVTVNGKTKLVSAKKAEKLDKKWERDIYTVQGAVAIHNKMAEHFNERIGALNDRYKDADFSKTNWENPAKWNDREMQYARDVDKLTTESYTFAAKEVHGSSPTGKRHAELSEDGKSIIVKKSDVKHADETNAVAVLKITRNDKGLIIKTEPLISEEEDVEHTAEVGADFLEHYGVKGMKWGVRKQRAVAGVKKGLKAFGRGLAAMGAALAESSWQNSTYNDVKHEQVHNHVAKEIDNRVDRLQRSPKYAGKDLKADSNLRKEYYQDVAKVSNAAYKRGVKEVYGDNPAGDKTAHYVNDVRGARIEIREKKSGEKVSEAPLTSLKEIRRKREEQSMGMEHAAITNAPDISINLKLDANGQVSGVGFIKPSAESLAQSISMTTEELGAMFLEHYGVKGMKWGVRRRDPHPVAPSATSKVPHGARRRTKVEVKGGENHPAHEDAIKVAEARAKLSKSGTAALSNKELRDVADRLRLEEQVTQMTRSKGNKFIREITSNQGRQAANQAVRNEVDRRIFGKNK